jgi:hypothetical protein
MAGTARSDEAVALGALVKATQIAANSANTQQAKVRTLPGMKRGWSIDNLYLMKFLQICRNSIADAITAQRVKKLSTGQVADEIERVLIVTNREVVTASVLDKAGHFHKKAGGATSMFLLQDDRTMSALEMGQHLHHPKAFGDGRQLRRLRVGGLMRGALLCFQA